MILDRRHQEVRVRMPCLVYLSPLVSHKEHQWAFMRRESHNLTASFMIVGRLVSAVWLALHATHQYTRWT